MAQIKGNRQRIKLKALCGLLAIIAIGVMIKLGVGVIEDWRAWHRITNQADFSNGGPEGIISLCQSYLTNYPHSLWRRNAEKQLAINEDNVCSNLILAAKAAEKHNDWETAEDAYNKALLVKPTNLTLRMEINAQIGKNNPYLVAQYIIKGRAASNDLEKAKAFFEKALKIEPENTLATNCRNEVIDHMYLGLITQAQAFKKKYNLDIEREWDSAAVHDWQEETNCYTKAIELKPNFFEAYLARGKAMEFWGSYEIAASDYTKVIELESDQLAKASAYFGRANVRAHGFIGFDGHPHSFAAATRDECDNAIADYGRAIQLNPDFAKAYCNRGRVKEFKNKFIDLEFDPELRYNQLPKVKKIEADIDGARADFTKAIELKPDYAEAYCYRGDSEFGSGDLGGAMADYTKAIELKPNFILPYSHRGYLKREMGDIYGAAKDFEKEMKAPVGADIEFKRLD